MTRYEEARIFVGEPRKKKARASRFARLISMILHWRASLRNESDSKTITQWKGRSLQQTVRVESVFLGWPVDGASSDDGDSTAAVVLIVISMAQTPQVPLLSTAVLQYIVQYS